MKFCSQCGHEVALTVPEGDTLPRHVCGQCGTIHYENPKVVVGCVPEYEGRILLCKRAIEPRLGYWTVPAGFMGSLLPKPQACFIGFGEPLDLSEHKGKKLSKTKLKSLRQEVADRIEGELSQLLMLRERKRGHDGVLRRLLTL